MHALIYRAVAAAMLAAASLGFTSVPAAATAGGPCAPPDSSGLVVCTFDGNAGTAPATYALAIPAGSPDFTVDVFGAQGGKGNSTPPVPTGLGAEARAKFTAPPGGTSLSLTVAGAGATGTTPNGGRGYEAGGSGGAPAASGIVPGAGGGGSSAVVDGTKLLADAAGGGGAGSGITSLDVNGGNAGGAGATGVQGPSSSPGAGGSGATSSSAGSGGQGGSCNGQTGASGTGAGGQGGPVTVIIGAIGGGPGGGGGGGFFGGGGGGQGGWCPPSAQSPFNISGGGGGGGGSSYVSSSATSSTILDGANAPQAGNGKVVVSYPMPITLTSFTPGSGRVGSRVTLTGSGFTWASSIKFGGTVAKFTIVSDTEIMTTAPYRALSSRITVANSAGAAATSASRFAVKPGISGFSPRSGRPGTSVTITGTAFTGATKVTFHGVRASFKVTSYGRITAIVPRHATTGPIRVSTPAGAAKTRRTFRVT